MLDALVVGRGPAALAAAASLAGEGLRTGVAGPPGPVHWPATYGVWPDALHEPCCPMFVQHRWPRAVVHTGTRSHALERGYAVVDNARLAAWLVERCETGGVAWLDGEVGDARHSARGTEVRLKDGRTVQARVVVDASGHAPALARRPASPPPAFQTAVGWEIETDGHPFAPDEAVLMDWRDGHLAESERGEVPSFLYAFPLDGERVFVEETVLAARPAVGTEMLERRLKARLGAMGISPRRVIRTEQVWIPMGGALPRPGRVVGFGAAGGLVHPATGYSLARSLSAAPVLARAVAAALGSGGTPAGAARFAWQALWPAERRRRYALFRFGLEVLLRLDAVGTRAFFDAFFSLPDEDWRGYLDDALPARALSRVMARLFRAVDPAVRREMVRATAGPAGARLAASLLAPGAE